MLKDCLEVFERQMEKVRIKGRGEDSLILDSYIPADGCYILVNSKGEIICQVDLKFNKKPNKWKGFPNDTMINYAFLIIIAVL